MPSPPDRPSDPPRRTLCVIGNFDGVHRGHRHMLDRAAREAGVAGLEPIVLTFEPHPASVLGRPAPALLTRLERKIELVRRVDPAFRVVAHAFDRELAASPPEKFAREILVAELHAARVLVGENFRFGQGRSGDLATLSELGAELGFVAHAHDMVGDERGNWSSTRARKAVAAGDWADVEAVLGRPHALSGVVVEGDRRGRTIGFPTANLGDVVEALPPDGVYAVLVDRLDASGRGAALAGGVANLGVRPTMGAGRSIEIHLFDFDGDLYGARLRVHLVGHLRDERKFDGLDALKAQIAADAAAGRALVANRHVDPGAGGAWY